MQSQCPIPASPTPIPRDIVTSTSSVPSPPEDTAVYCGEGAAGAASSVHPASIKQRSPLAAAPPSVTSQYVEFEETEGGLVQPWKMVVHVSGEAYAGTACVTWHAYLTQAGIRLSFVHPAAPKEPLCIGRAMRRHATTALTQALLGEGDDDGYFLVKVPAPAGSRSTSHRPRWWNVLYILTYLRDDVLPHLNAQLSGVTPFTRTLRWMQEMSIVKDDDNEVRYPQLALIPASIRGKQVLSLGTETHPLGLPPPSAFFARLPHFQLLCTGATHFSDLFLSVLQVEHECDETGNAVGDMALILIRGLPRYLVQFDAPEEEELQKHGKPGSHARHTAMQDEFLLSVSGPATVIPIDLSYVEQLKFPSVTSQWLNLNPAYSQFTDRAAVRGKESSDALRYGVCCNTYAYLIDVARVALTMARRSVLDFVALHCIAVRSKYQCIEWDEEDSG